MKQVVSCLSKWRGRISPPLSPWTRSSALCSRFAQAPGHTPSTRAFPVARLQIFSLVAILPSEHSVDFCSYSALSPRLKAV